MDRAVQGVTALHAPSAYTPRMVYDTIVHTPKTLRFLGETVGLEQLVLGTDESFPPADIDPLSSLRAAGFLQHNDSTDYGGQSAPIFPRSLNK